MDLRLRLRTHRNERGWQASRGFGGKITVPFCPESKLSGVAHTDFINSIWYQRNIDIPQAWQGKRILLNFGAADYETHVYIDGKLAGSHYGAGSSFAVDITRFAEGATHHNLVVQVNDNLRDGHQTEANRALAQAHTDASTHASRASGRPCGLKPLTRKE